MPMFALNAYVLRAPELEVISAWAAVLSFLETGL